MGLKPDYQVKSDAVDITTKLRRRNMSLRLTDEAGMESDVLEITLSDNDPDDYIELPKTGAELTVSMGYDKKLQHMGMFVCDEIELSFWPGEMVIRARAAIQDKTPAGKPSMRTQRTREWPAGTTLGSMVRKIAQEHRMTPAVSQKLDGVSLPHTAQADESDLSFLVRMAKKYDAVVKPADGRLILAKKGESKSVSGKDLPVITLRPTDISRGRVSMSKRETAGQVTAYYHATKQAKRHEVTAGQGEPVHRLKMYYPTKDMALAAARSELERRTRAKTTLAFTMPGRTDLAAEGKLILRGFRPGVEGEWIITRAEHSMDDAGYVCNVEAELPNAKGETETSDEAE